MSALPLLWRDFECVNLNSKYACACLAYEFSFNDQNSYTQIKIQRNYLREGTLQATETLQKKWSRRTEFESLKVNKKILDFGLRIKAVTGIHITAPKIKHDWVQQGM